MSIQTGVYVDGHWTTRTMDINQVVDLNRDQPHQKKSSSALGPSQQPPILGILTQTVIRSPVIKFVIPARIRHEDKNDVVFIYDNFIEIKQIYPGGDGSMQHIAVKTDFDSAIRSAKIFGLPRKYCIYSGNDKDDLDTTIQPQVPPRIPPQILVMVLESSKLVFLFSFHHTPGHLRFVSYQWPLPPSQFNSEQLCEHITVDPKSRAIAVTTFEGSFTIYALTSMDEMKRSVEVGGRIQGDNFKPIKEERHINVGGVILNMEFLHPPEADLEKDHVLLLLVVSRHRGCVFFCFVWDCSTSLGTVELKGPGQSLHPADELPLLLVPLTKSGAFMSVSEKCMAVYSDILTGHAKRCLAIPSNEEPPEEPGSSRRLPIWTQWARPLRNEEHSKEEDNIYLCREDGVLHFLEIKDRAGCMLELTHQAGSLKVNIDTSFAILDMGVDMSRNTDVDLELTEVKHEIGEHHSVDILVAGGDLSDGGRWSLEARGVANKIDVISNWTPLLDLIAVERARNNGAIFGPCAIQDQMRFFASTGRGSTHGTITEIRYGAQAMKKTTLIKLHENPGIVISEIWVLTGFNRRIFVLLSYPSHTSLVQIHVLDEPPDEMDSAGYEICEDARTIAAGMSAESLIVQVTRTSVRATMPKAEMAPLHRQEKILAAFVRRDRDNDARMALLMAIQNDDGIHLHLAYLSTEDGQICYHSVGRPVILDFEPVSISLEYVDDETIAIVSTAISTLHVFRMDLTSDLVPVFEYAFDGQFAICDSIAVLTMHSYYSRQYLVLCGLRNGAVEVLGLNLRSHDPVILSFYERLHIGSTTVTVVTDKTRISRAIVVCEQKMRYLEYPLGLYATAQVPASLINIWLTDLDQPGFQQGGITAVAQVKSGLDPDLLLCVEGNKTHVAYVPLDSAPCMVPRRIHVQGTPTRVIYSQRLNKLIVLYYQIIVPHSAKSAGHGGKSDIRSLQYKIAIVDPDVESLGPNPDEDNLLQSKFTGKLGERFLGVTEWFPQSGERVHHMLVVHTLLEKPILSKSRGSILFFSVSDTGHLTLERQDGKDSPVHALVPYGPNSLLYCCGKDLYLQTREETINESAGSSGKMQEPVKYGLNTRGFHISTHGPLIYVTTDGNGLSIFKHEGDKLIPYLNDEIARQGLYHLAFPEQSLIITSQRTSTIAGIWQPPERSVSNSTSTVFTATLPGSITRFCQIRRPPWQRHLHIKASGHPQPAEPSQPETEPLAPSWSEPILGSTTNGTIMQLEILDKRSWRLLRFLQNMAMRDPLICPFGDPLVLRKRHIEPSPALKDNLHVNGDILRRILERGAEPLLRAMLERDPPKPDRRGESGDFTHAYWRQARFTAMAAAVGLVWLDVDDLMVKVIRWLRYRLQVAL